MTKTIPGSPGSAPQGQGDVQPHPAADAGERTGRLERDAQGLLVRWGSTVIRVDPASAARFTVGAGDARRTSFRIPDAFARAMDVARKHEAEFLRQPEVVSVRAGFRFENGWITSDPCIVVAVRRRKEAPLGPPVLDGFAVETTLADPLEQLHGQEAATIPAAMAPASARTLVEAIQGMATEAEEAARVITYEPPPQADLDPVTAAMTITCCVSPDSGWTVLRPFLLETRSKMRLGMYDFTAPHIYKAARTVLKDTDVSWHQVLGPKESLPAEDDVDSTKANDLPEHKVNEGLRRAGGARFQAAFARTGSGGTFASAYHIKVAVRDDSDFWLSSGNWQSSNQPDIDFAAPDADRREIPRYNREWHVVVECAELARKFQKYLEHDFRTARASPEAEAAPAMPDLLVPLEEFLAEEAAAADLEVFPPHRRSYPASRPLTVQPILTPDNYMPIVLQLLRERPARTLYFQNQSLNPVKSPTEDYAELLQLLADYSQDDELDVRIIFRNIGPVRKKLESLQLAGFNMDRVRMQAGCHNKGMVIDGETLLVGSHNWTNDGTQFNRDASLLIRDRTLAHYYEKVFLHDWEKLSRATVRPESMPLLASATEAAQLEETGRYVRVPWSYYEED